MRYVLARNVGSIGCIVTDLGSVRVNLSFTTVENLAQ